MQEFLRVNANERTGKIRKGSKSRTIVFFFFQTRSLGSVDDDSWNLLDERERERRRITKLRSKRRKFERKEKSCSFDHKRALIECDSR